MDMHAYGWRAMRCDAMRFLLRPSNLAAGNIITLTLLIITYGVVM